MFGSANWDPRNRRLNFEFNVECYGSALTASLEQIARERIGRVRPVTLEDVDGRNLPVKLRDGVTRADGALPVRYLVSEARPSNQTRPYSWAGDWMS